MDARDLFDQVLFNRDVEAAGRRGHAPAVGNRLHAQSKRAQDAFDFGIGHAHAEHARETLAAQADDLRLRKIGLAHGFDHRTRHSASDVENEFGRVFDGDPRQLRINAALEAMASVGVQAEFAAAADDRGGRKVRRLQKHVTRGGRHHRVFATHDSGDGDCAFLTVRVPQVGND